MANTPKTVIYPVKRTHIVNKLAGKYKNKGSRTTNLTAIKDAAMNIAMQEKYGHT